MSRKPSDKTQLATLRKLSNTLMADKTYLLKEVNHYRARATKAEQEAAEWKARFDKLLEFRKAGLGDER